MKLSTSSVEMTTSLVRPFPCQGYYFSDCVVAERSGY
jgi:hypothetical protein